jgi:hypothetical protein
MSNFVVHTNVCCVCREQKVVMNFQCNTEHEQPMLICRECCVGWIAIIDDYNPNDEHDFQEEDDNSGGPDSWNYFSMSD